MPVIAAIASTFCSGRSGRQFAIVRANLPASTSKCSNDFLKLAMVLALFCPYFLQDAHELMNQCMDQLRFDALAIRGSSEKVWFDGLCSSV